MPNIKTFIPNCLPKDFIDQIYEYPHKIGHLVGKNKLTEMHSEWIHYIWNTENVPDKEGLLNTHRSLQGHRGSFKTTACTEIGHIWWLLFHPNARILMIRKPYSEAAKTLWTIKQYMSTEPLEALFYYIHGMRPKMVVKKENSVTWNFKQSITKEGNIDICSTDSVKTGSHYDKIIGDDIVTIKDRTSSAERENTKNAVREILTNIIDPGNTVGFIGTPWHKDDAHSILPSPIQYTPEDTNILTEEELEQKRKTTTQTLFDINYWLKHTASDDCPFNNIRYTKWDYKVNPFAHIDAKFDGDHSGALTFVQEQPNQDLVVWGNLFYENVKGKREWIRYWYEKLRSKMIWIEDNPDQGYTADLIKESHPGKKPMKVSRYHEDMNKGHKIESFISYYWERIKFHDECDPDYISQIMDWKEGEEPDDAPDSLASLLRKAFYKKTNVNALWE
jgi:hypothetical protein